jgi:hypothetical protein
MELSGAIYKKPMKEFKEHLAAPRGINEDEGRVPGRVRDPRRAKNRATLRGS